MIDTWDVTVPALTGDEPRRAYVYLPESYEREPERRYPVLYMFDGHNVFFDEDATYGKSWGMGSYMDFSGTQLIIAAVECNRSPDNSRLIEYSPFTFEDDSMGRVAGRGRTTMRWLIHSFKPYIDEHFRTLPGRRYTFIAGSSMGGLMSLFALIAYNRVFSRAAALSPSLWTSPAAIRDLIQKTPLRANTVLYMDYGSREFRNHPDMARQYRAVCDLLMRKEVYLTSRVVPRGEHSEASWEKQIPFFMETLLYGL